MEAIKFSWYGFEPKNWWVAKVVTYYAIFILCGPQCQQLIKHWSFINYVWNVTLYWSMGASNSKKHHINNIYTCTNYRATHSKKIQCHPLPTNSNSHSTWAALAQIILFLFLPNFSAKDSFECWKSWKFNHHKWPDSYSQPVWGGSTAFHQV